MSTANEIASIKKSIEDINARFEIIEKQLTKLELNQNDFIKKTKEIKKGISTKVAFDSNGLITNSLSLVPEDIPEISITKIKNLTETIESLNSLINQIKTEVSTLQKSIQILENSKDPKEKIPTVESIPNLPISKISGLREKLELVEKPIIYNEPKTEKQKILESDIPAIFKNRINNLEEIIQDKATINSLDQLRKKITDSESEIFNLKKEIESIKLNNKTQLKSNDLPEIPISKVINLKVELSKKADHSEVNSFHSLIDLTNRSTSNQFKHIREDLDYKIDYGTFSIIENRILHLEELVGNFLQEYPIDKIIEEINLLKDKIK